MAGRIQEASEDSLRFAPPEAKGHWLAVLLQPKELWAYFEEPEEAAALRVIEWIQTKREFREVCQRITLDGSKFENWRTGEERLRGFFDWSEREEYRDELDRISTQGIYQRLPRQVEPHTPVQRTWHT